MIIPAADGHLDQARRNLAHAEYLLRDHAADPTCVQWAVTAAFYCAVHCLQAHVLRAGADPRTHVRRAELIADPAFLVPTDVQQRIIGHHLANVTAFVGL